MADIAKKSETPRDLLRRQLMSQEFTDQLKLVLPPNLPPERLARQALTLTQETPGLLECTPQSFLMGVMRAAELNLLLSGPLGQAYLIPRGGKAAFQLGYRGYGVLAWRSGQVRIFAAHEVREGDMFHFRFGTEPRIIHEWANDRSTSVHQEEGKFTHYYAVTEFITGGKDFEVFTHKEMVEHRARYSPKKAKPTPWDTNWLPMALKTTMRRLGKRMPMATELQHASMMDEYGEAGVERISSHAGTAGLLSSLGMEPDEEPPEPTREVVHEDGKGDSYEGDGHTNMRE